MTRSEMAALIRKIAGNDHTDDEWATSMPTHYQDIPTENARRKTVEVCLGYSDVSPEKKREFLLGIANGLEQTTHDCEFYYRSEAVGVLKEPPPSAAKCEVGYEPYRGPGHHALATLLDEGKSAVCEYMNDGNRREFIVHGCPSYGRLTIAVESTQT